MARQRTRMNEVVVGLTDYLLTLECAVFAGMLMRTAGGSPEMRLFFAVFFLALALTSLTGGANHWWFPASAYLPANDLCEMTVVGLAAVALGAWGGGASTLFAGAARGGGS